MATKIRNSIHNLDILCLQKFIVGLTSNLSCMETHMMWLENDTYIYVCVCVWLGNVSMIFVLLNLLQI
jgi:hypothetical protein